MVSRRILPSFLEVFNNVFKHIGSGCLFRSKQSFEESLCPYDAVDELLRLLSNGADREGLLLDAFDALVAGRDSFLDAEGCHFIAVGACFNKGLV